MSVENSGSFFVAKPLSIRPAGYSDFAGLYGMISDLESTLDFGGKPLSDMDLIDCLLAPVPWLKYLVAEQDHHLCGYICLTGDLSASTLRPSLDLWQIYVKPQDRGKGIGQALIEAARSTAQHLGYTHLSVDRFTGDTDHDRTYRAYGFRGQPDLGRMQMPLT